MIGARATCVALFGITSVDRWRNQMFAAENCVCSYFHWFISREWKDFPFHVEWHVAERSAMMQRYVFAGLDSGQWWWRWWCDDTLHSPDRHQINNKNLIIFCPCGHGTMYESVTSHGRQEVERNEKQIPEILRRCNVRRLLDKPRVTSFHAARIRQISEKYSPSRSSCFLLLLFVSSLFLFSSISIWKRETWKMPKDLLDSFRNLTFASCVSI